MSRQLWPHDIVRRNWLTNFERSREKRPDSNTVMEPKFREKRKIQANLDRPLPRLSYLFLKSKVICLALGVQVYGFTSHG